MSTARAYPSARETDVVLRDGSTIRVRPIRADDEDAVLELLRGLSVDSSTYRFVSAGADLGRAARDAVDARVRVEAPPKRPSPSLGQ